MTTNNSDLLQAVDRALDERSLTWAARWIEDSLTGETNERVIEFGKNMAMTLRAAGLSDVRTADAGPRGDTLLEIIKQVTQKHHQSRTHPPTYCCPEDESVYDRLFARMLVEAIDAATSSPTPAESDSCSPWREAASIVEACLNVHSTYSDVEREFASHLIEVFKTRDQHPDYKHRNAVRAYPVTAAPADNDAESSLLSKITTIADITTPKGDR